MSPREQFWRRGLGPEVYTAKTSWTKKGSKEDPVSNILSYGKLEKEERQIWGGEQKLENNGNQPTYCLETLTK